MELMVIGPFHLCRSAARVVVVLAVILSPALRTIADDQITKNDGSVVTGQIVGASGGQAMIQTKTSTGGVAKFPIQITDIRSINMTVPPGVAAADAPGATSEQVIAALAPVVKQYAGLPVDWIVNAMARLGAAYSETGHPDQATAVYNDILKNYGNSMYATVAKAGMAGLSLKAGKVDEALAAVQPIVDQANKNIAPSPSEGSMYANAFIVRGQALESKKDYPAALEAYLTVTTMFYQNAALATQADALAKKLRAAQPGVSVQ